MKQEKVETRLDMLEKETKASGKYLDKLKMDLMGEIEGLKVEVATLRLFIERRHPVVKEELDKVRKEVIEGMGNAPATGKKRAAA